MRKKVCTVCCFLCTHTHSIKYNNSIQCMKNKMLISKYMFSKIVELNSNNISLEFEINLISFPNFQAHWTENYEFKNGFNYFRMKILSINWLSIEQCIKLYINIDCKKLKQVHCDLFNWSIEWNKSNTYTSIFKSELSWTYEKNVWITRYYIYIITLYFPKVYRIMKTKWNFKSFYCNFLRSNKLYNFPSELFSIVIPFFFTKNNLYLQLV